MSGEWWQTAWQNKGSGLASKPAGGKKRVGREPSKLKKIALGV